MDVVTLNQDEITRFLDWLSFNLPIRQLDVAVDDIDQAFKVKVNGGTWSPPLGTMNGGR
jgi:hypothetical protein